MDEEGLGEEDIEAAKVIFISNIPNYIIFYTVLYYDS